MIPSIPAHHATPISVKTRSSTVYLGSDSRGPFPRKGSLTLHKVSRRRPARPQFHARLGGHYAAYLAGNSNLAIAAPLSLVVPKVRLAWYGPLENMCATRCWHGHGSSGHDSSVMTYSEAPTQLTETADVHLFEGTDHWHENEDSGDQDEVQLTHVSAGIHRCA